METARSLQMEIPLEEWRNEKADNLEQFAIWNTARMKDHGGRSHGGFREVVRQVDPSFKSVLGLVFLSQLVTK